MSDLQLLLWAMGLGYVISRLGGAAVVAYIAVIILCAILYRLLVWWEGYRFMKRHRRSL